MTQPPRKQATLDKFRFTVNLKTKSANEIPTVSLSNNNPRHKQKVKRQDSKTKQMGTLFAKPEDLIAKKRSSYIRERGCRDLELYRKGYPDKVDDTRLKENLLFHRNEIKSKPDGDYIDIIHEEWITDYEKLERHHGYIQWLFPIRESGMNWLSQELQAHEAKAIQADPTLKDRVLLSYKMMLGFYGMVLMPDGKVSRAENWQSRFQHLNRSMHNYLRITRILKCLGELGYEDLKYPWVDFLLTEACQHNTLPNTLESCIVYWIETIKDDKKRHILKEKAKKFSS